MKRLLGTVLIATALFCAGCGLVSLTDDEVERIAQGAGGVAGSIVQKTTDTYAPGLGAGAGVVVTGALALGIRALLKAIRKNPAEGSDGSN